MVPSDTEPAVPASARTWADTFPWLRGCAPDVPWLNQPVRAMGNAQLRQIVGEVAMYASQRCGQTIGHLFPETVGYPLEARDLPTRLRNVVRSSQLTLGAALWSMTVADLSGLRNVGARTVLDLLLELVWITVIPDEDFTALRAAEIACVRDVQTLADLKVQLGFEDDRVFPTQNRDDLLHLDDATAQRILDMTWGTLYRGTLGTSQHGEFTEDEAIVAEAEEPLTWGDVAPLLEDTVEQFGARGWAIFDGRCAGTPAVTLDDIGMQFGVTRERVRQVEGKLREKLAELGGDGGALEALLSVLRSAFAAPTPVADVYREWPALADAVGGAGNNVLGVVALIDDGVFADDGWVANRPLADLRAATVKAVDECLGDHGAARFDEVRACVDEELGCAVEAFDQWAAACGFDTVNGWVMRHGGSQVQRTVAALHIAGEPMTLSQIVAELGDVSEKSLSQRLAEAPQVVRTDVSSWGLADWDVLEYKSIRDNIRDLLDERGGRVLVSEVEDFLCSRFSVSRSSVHQYATSYPFVAVDGYCLVDPSPHGPRHAARPAARVFRQEERWAYRIRVTSEHLRGSGFPVPTYLAEKLGLRPGERTTLRTEQGTHTFSWVGLQPQSSSIRGHLLELGADVGDDVFALCTDAGEFLLVRAVHGGGSPMQRAFALIGARPDTPVTMARQLFAQAGEFEPGTLRELAAEYANRGDDDIADALREAAGDASPA